MEGPRNRTTVAVAKINDDPGGIIGSNSDCRSSFYWAVLIPGNSGVRFRCPSSITIIFMSSWPPLLHYSCWCTVQPPFSSKKNTVGKQIGDSWRGTNEVFAWRKKNSASVVSCRYGPLDRCDLRDFFDENENSPHPKRINRVTWIDFPPTAQPIRLTLTGQQSWDGFTRNKCCTLQCLSFLVHGRCPWQLVKLTLNGQRPSGARLEFWSTVRSRCGQHSILVFFFTDRKKN